jgi:ribonuclease HI
MKDEEQKAKEKVIQLGISKGLAIFTRGEEIVSKDGEGHENIISTSDDKSTRWQDALKVLLEDNSVTKTTEKQRSLKVYTDGGSRGNPGPSASGYVIMNEENEIIEEGGEYLGITTNNQAEYQAVKQALQASVKFDPHEIHFFVDSLLVVNQLKGIYKIKNRDLWPIHSDIKDIAENFDKVTYTHVRREHNKLADAKVNEVLDSHTS